MAAIDESELINLLDGIIALETVNPPGNESVLADYFVDRLGAPPVNFEVECQEVQPDRPNVIARAGDPTKGSLLLTGHMDVVPTTPEDWSGNPFGLRRKDDQLIGRGTADMKGALAAKLAAAEAFLTEYNDTGEVILAFTVDEATDETRRFTLDHIEELESHYSAGRCFDSDLERTLAQKWERANTEWELVREDDVFDLGAEVMIPDFAVEHPDGRRAILEIVGFWTPEYLDEKLSKIRQTDADNLLLAVSEQLDCASEDFGTAADRVLWFKTGIHVYDVVDLADSYATQPTEA